MYSYDYHIAKGLAYRFKLINKRVNKTVGYININLSRLKNHKYNTYVKIDINSKKNNSFYDYEGYKLLSSLEYEIYLLLDFVFIPSTFVTKVLLLGSDNIYYKIVEVKNNIYADF